VMLLIGFAAIGAERIYDRETRYASKQARGTTQRSVRSCSQ
jgi:hypothetical protein